MKDLFTPPEIFQFKGRLYPAAMIFGLPNPPVYIHDIFLADDDDTVALSGFRNWFAT